jgi:hypothetical protein
VDDSRGLITSDKADVNTKAGKSIMLEDSCSGSGKPALSEGSGKVDEDASGAQETKSTKDSKDSLKGIGTSILSGEADTADAKEESKVKDTKAGKDTSRGLMASFLSETSDKTDENPKRVKGGQLKKDSSPEMSDMADKTAEKANTGKAEKGASKELSTPISSSGNYRQGEMTLRRSSARQYL